MIAILRESIFNHTNCNDSCCTTENEIYDKVLGALEEAGMLPPAYEIKGPFAESDGPIYRTDNYYVDGIADWESE
jgi:hypothetical protein